MLKSCLNDIKIHGEIKPRLVLNHLTVLYNVFNPPMACTIMLTFKLEEYLEYLKPFLLQLSYWPERIELNGKIIIGNEVNQDEVISKLLQKEISNVKTV